MSSNRLNFQFNWKLTPRPIDDQQKKTKLIESKLFATNYNDITYIWYIEIAQVSINDDNLIRASLCYRAGPQKELDCVGTFRIVSDTGYDITEDEITSLQIGENDGGWNVVYCRFQTELDRQYRDTSRRHIQIGVNLSLSENLFDTIVCIPPIKLSSTVSTNDDKLMQVAISGEKNTGCANVKLICNGGEFFINPSTFLNASTYFKSLFVFDKTTNVDEKQVDLSHITKEIMIIVRFRSHLDNQCRLKSAGCSESNTPPLPYLPVHQKAGRPNQLISHIFPWYPLT